jgi:hypothetical protein
LKCLEATVATMPAAAREFVPSYVRTAATLRQSQARLRCTAAALATERYRLAHGEWPTSLEAPVPEYLAQVPKSPTSGKPLRYRRVDDGVVIDSPEEGQDAGARLWDPSRRHQQRQ